MWCVHACLFVLLIAVCQDCCARAQRYAVTEVSSVAIWKGCEILMNNIVTARERCRWAAEVPLYPATHEDTHTDTFCTPRVLLMADSILLLSIILITCGWVEVIRIGTLLFLGPASWWDLHSHGFLINPVSEGQHRHTRGQREDGDLESLCFVLIKRLAKMILFEVNIIYVLSNTMRDVQHNLTEICNYFTRWVIRVKLFVRFKYDLLPLQWRQV